MPPQMVDTDILLSPCGGTSMTGLFLQVGRGAGRSRVVLRGKALSDHRAFCSAVRLAPHFCCRHHKSLCAAQTSDWTCRTNVCNDWQYIALCCCTILHPLIVRHVPVPSLSPYGLKSYPTRMCCHMWTSLAQLRPHCRLYVCLANDIPCMPATAIQAGSAAILIDYFSTHLNKSLPMDDIMWRQLGGVLTRHYFFTKDEVHLPDIATIKPPSEAWDPYLLYRNHGQVVINAERLLEVVEGVVKWIRRDAGRLARSDSGGWGL